MGDSWPIIVATEALLGLVEASTEWRNVARMGAMWLASLTTPGSAANQSFSQSACEHACARLMDPIRTSKEHNHHAF